MSIASRPSFSDDSRIIKRPLPKSLLLRDYLRDDMSSCSSNGFRSYPRRQCCTTVVRLLVETDLNINRKFPSKHHRQTVFQTKTDLKQSSVLQKASTVMINAFKHLPFAGTGAGISRKVSFLPRSLSRKLLKHGFWKKTDHRKTEVKRLTSFADLLKLKEISPPPSPPRSPSQVSTAVTTATTAELTSSTSNSNSDSWSGSDFTAFTTGNYSDVNLTQNVVNLAQNDVGEESPENEKTSNGDTVGTTTVTATGTKYSDSTDNAKLVGDDMIQKKWQDKHEEQFSPVSVMDFPNDNDYDNDEGDEVSSVSHNHLGGKGTKISTCKTRVSDRVTQLEPVKLEDRIAQMVLESSTTTFKENQDEKKAIALLQLMKSTLSSHNSLKYEAIESVLLDFFKEVAFGENVSNYTMLQKAKEWMDGQEEEMFIDWECEVNRGICVRDMEKGVKWSNYDHEVEKVNVCLEVECEIFSSLVNDVLTEFCC